ncbi:hypothetical protein K435DRAFT_780185 [Dendrothele bispora CBS 962.96]|uniref:Uncharacterized protein n=1 Tax=Dendrothele bispora (strain CBS 962.96) TaxID=1314807 RepID=A0A4S8KYX9_DENBC|nr:hypothetical protein K435DRAFT_785511 [Dendrothele bispora CBS 962.96]THU81279.1 hypothetical protein K435DRAFT_785074 [Dendrothele bispora CBS 962.96]THU92226.1 hypothetical protein K435DRAFT_780323 [Dendrothele bispora CBS 962.96]THU92572.1 hypothetical protein K435DRAFT_780185 [Dendrothele bispora CBS 962.96]
MLSNCRRAQMWLNHVSNLPEWCPPILSSCPNNSSTHAVINFRWSSTARPVFC